PCLFKNDSLTEGQIMARRWVLLISWLLLTFPAFLPLHATAQPIDSRPMTDSELQLLIQALEPVDLPDGKGWGIAAVIKGSTLPAERMTLLLGDAMAVLAETHAKETLDRLKRTSGVQPSILVQAERALELARDRARARFASRSPGHAESTRLVTAHRAALERV